MDKLLNVKLTKRQAEVLLKVCGMLTESDAQTLVAGAVRATLDSCMGALLDELDPKSKGAP